MPKHSMQLKTVELKGPGSISNGIYTLQIPSSNPQLTDIEGFNFTVDSLESLSNDEVETIRIVVAAQGVVYQATLLDFAKLGTLDLDPVFGLQLYLPSEFWNVTQMDSIDAIEAYSPGNKVPGLAAATAGLAELQENPQAKETYPYEKV